MRRTQQGDSWHVQVALARTRRWIRDLGRAKQGLAMAIPVVDLMEDSASGSGRLRAVRHTGNAGALEPPVGACGHPFRDVAVRFGT